MDKRLHITTGETGTEWVESADKYMDYVIYHCRHCDEEFFASPPDIREVENSISNHLLDEHKEKLNIHTNNKK